MQVSQTLMLGQINSDSPRVLISSQAVNCQRYLITTPSLLSFVFGFLNLIQLTLRPPSLSLFLHTVSMIDLFVGIHGDIQNM